MSSPRPIDALFISYFEDVDLWHNDHLRDSSVASVTGLREDQDHSGTDLTPEGRRLRQSVSLDGNLYNLPRFLSLVRYGTTAEYPRYHAFAATQLLGSYFRSLLGPLGYEVAHVNALHRESVEDLASQVAPKYIMLSTSFLAETARITDACQRLRAAFPGASIIVGGLVLLELHHSLNPIALKHMFNAWGADAYVVSANGVTAVLEALKRDPKDLASLTLKDVFVKRNGEYGEAGDEVEVPYPLDENPILWSRLAPESLHSAVITRTARSCAYSCAFCTFPVLQGALETSSPTTFARELDELTANGKVKSLLFTDDTFNIPPKRFKELCSVLKDYDFEWYSFFRAQHCDAETARLMKESGCQTVFLGVESLDNGVLKNMHKVSTREKVERGVGHLKDNGIACHANFIIGYPGDRPEYTQRIVPFLDRFEIEFFCVGPYSHSPTAPIDREREAYGLEGNYWRWKHNTMDVAQAIDLERELLEAPKHSVFFSEIAHDTFWGEAILQSGGFTVEEVRLAGSVYNQLAGTDTSIESAQALARETGLARLLEQRTLPSPVDTPGVTE